MERLWAPWRIDYIQMEKPQGCFFCQKVHERRDEANFILVRGNSNFVLLNSYPYNPGHLLVAPYRHTGDLHDLSLEEMLEHWELVRRMVRLLQDAMGPQGYNIGINLGKLAGAGVVDHFHSHIVPRWEGDTNFMPVLADTKVIPDGVAATYKRLKEKL